MADDRFQLQARSLLVRASQDVDTPLRSPDEARQTAPGLWENFTSSIKSDAGANLSHHGAVPLLDFLFKTADSACWFPQATTQQYLRDGLEMGFAALQENGITFTDRAKAAFAWEGLRASEREALDGQTGTYDEEKVAVRDSFTLIQEEFKDQRGAEPWDPRKEANLFQDRRQKVMARVHQRRAAADAME